MKKKAFSEILGSWLIKFKRYAVSYKKGFFHLRNLANSPSTIIKSFDHMPFCKHDQEKKLLTADTPFLKAQLFYFELEEGLCIFVSDLNYRKNLLMTNIYDKSLPMDYHFLNLHYREKSIKSKSMMVNGLLLSDKTWSVFKSNSAISDYHFKDSDEKNITIYFTDKWLEKKSSQKESWKKSKFNTFMNSENKYILYTDEERDTDYFYDQFLSLTQLKDSNSKREEIATLTDHFFECFFQIVNKEFFSDEYFKLEDKDRKYVKLAENLLLDNLLNEFPGIEYIANKVGVSPTKLKADFKTIHNKTLYHYYSYYQMKMAYRMLSNGEGNIKEIAKTFGYDNSSKFAAKFKEHFNVAPSTIIEKKV